MTEPKITDWDDAYSNRAHIPNALDWIEAWRTAAEEYRSIAAPDLQQNISYGPHARNQYDLFHPAHKPHGLFVFIHGGYWMDFDKSYWSHLAQGAVDAGWAVAIPSYVLCPEASIADITAMMATAITHAADTINGPIVLSGHSAGGHLVASMQNKKSPLRTDIQSRMAHVVSISGVHDLRPLLKTTMNNTLKLSSDTASKLSPALMEPITNAQFTAWVGGSERPEFIRQSELQSNIWRGLGVQTTCVIEPLKHHFNIIEALTDCNSDLCRAALKLA